MTDAAGRPIHLIGKTKLRLTLPNKISLHRSTDSKEWNSDATDRSRSFERFRSN